MSKSEQHEHVFVEEEEPHGRLILPPCVLCELTAMDALDTLRHQRDRAMAIVQQWFEDGREVTEALRFFLDLERVLAEQEKQQ